MKGWSEGAGRSVTTPQLAFKPTAADKAVPEDLVGKLLDDICELISHTTQATMVIIDQDKPNSSSLKVLGKTGTLVTEFDASCAIPDLDAKKMPFIVCRDVRHDLRFRGHPLVRLMPHVQSIMAFVIPGTAESSAVVLKVVNARKAAFADGDVMRFLSQVSVIISDVLKLAQQHERATSRSLAPKQLDRPTLLDRQHTPASATFEQLGSASIFLFETLVRKRGLHSRNSAEYVSLRTWRSPIKKYQIGALIALKQSPDPAFVAQAASEIVASVLQTHGAGVIKSVVPVPPGSSGGSQSLSTLLAEQVAQQLGASFWNVLQSVKPVRKGKSTPHMSSALEGYRLSAEPQGPVLVIDDVASSGRHIELALAACKQLSTAVYAIVWIAK